MPGSSFPHELSLRLSIDINMIEILPNVKKTISLFYTILTVNALEEDVEDAVAGDGKLALVQEAILNALLVVLVRIEVVFLQVVEEPTSD